MPTVSLCMIVKNEEAVLSRCLDSLAGLMDEIIIVDTGSTDRTKEIASTYTDKLYDFAWCDDFSAARNYALSFASCDYIYIADADEVLDEENRRKFADLKSVLLPEIEIVQMLYSGQYDSNTVYNFNEEYRPKLFKRLRTFSFMNPIHETLRLDPIVYDSEIRIFHKPHGLHTDRDLTIFKKHFGKPDSVPICAALLSMYGKELFISGSDAHFIDAIPIAERFLSSGEAAKDDLLIAASILAHSYRLRGDDAAFFKYAIKGALSDSCSEICMELGRYYEQHEDYEEAHLWYYNAYHEVSPVCNIHYGRKYPLEALVRISKIMQLNDLTALYSEELSRLSDSE